MTMPSRWVLGLSGAWLFALAAVTHLVRSVGVALRDLHQQQALALPHDTTRASPRLSVTSVMVDSILARDPFDLTASEDSDEVVQTYASRPPRPAWSVPPLRVVAIAGPPWRALLGVPGGESHHVAPGDSLFGLVVQSVSGTAVKLKSRDSLLVLHMGSVP